MYVQIANTDIYMATQNWKQNTANLQNEKYLLNLKQDLWEHLCSCRSLVQGHWSCTRHWNHNAETAFFIATPVKNMFSSSLFILPVGSFLVNLSTEKLWVQLHEILC